MKTIHIISETLPEGWEKSVVETWEKGSSFKTEYDKPGDPESKDVALMLHVKHPFAEPRIHRGFPGGLDDLEVYRNEVVLGCHDHWINPQEGKWSYTYSQRMFNYNGIDQIADVIDKLKKTPYSRRAQAIIWQPEIDMKNNHCPCLQRIWFRIEDNKLHMNTHMRSQDAYKAAFMNFFAWTELQKWVAEKIGVETGEFIHMVDSYHIYGSYFSEFEGFLKMVANRLFEGEGGRTFTTKFALPMFVDGCDRILRESDIPGDKKILVEKRKSYLETL